MKKLILATLLFTSCQDAYIKGLVDRYADKHGIDRKIAHGLVQVESSYNPKAVSNKGARGLTQIMWTYHHQRCNLHRPEQLFNASVNLDCGFSYLKKLYKKDYSIRNALSRYYSGRVSKVGLQYANKVLLRSKRS